MRLSKHLSFFVVSLLCGSVQADISIEELIEQSGIRAGQTAMRDVDAWRQPRKILIYGGWYIDPNIQTVAPELKFVRATTEAEAMAEAVDADAIIGSCSNKLVNAARHVSWVQISSAGAERCMRTERIVDGKVILTNMQKMSAPVIAEHAVAMILALARRLPQHINSMESGTWQSWEDDIINGQKSVGDMTLLIAGLGGIGTEVARRASALGMRVVGTRRSSRSAPEFVDYVGLSEELFELASQADVVVNALPLTAETSGLFDAEFFSAVKPGAYYVSIGRGKTTSTDDLVSALESGKIAGAGLDVTDPEPLPADHALWQMDNVIITSHSAGKGVQPIRHETLLRENLRRFVAGEALLNVVDPAKGY